MARGDHARGRVVALCSNSLALSREISRRGPHAPGYEIKAPSNVAPITRPLWVNASLSQHRRHPHRSRGLSGLTRLNAAARHNTRMGLWGGVRHPRFFWPVWRHILGGPMRVPSHANRGAGFAHTTVGVGGPGKATFWDAPSTPVALGGGWAACNLS